NGAIVGADLPRGGQTGNRLAVGGVLDQAVVQVLDDREVYRREGLRIEIVDVGKNRHPQFAALEVGSRTDGRSPQRHYRDQRGRRQPGWADEMELHVTWSPCAPSSGSMSRPQWNS